jgi:hypothetical protein
MSRQGHALSAGEDAGHLSSDARHAFQVLSEGPLSDDFLRDLHRRTPRRGEKRLALAILEDAVMRTRRNRPWVRMRRFLTTDEAERWIASRDRERLFSFENVCRILSVDPGEARSWILRGRARRPDPAANGPASAARWDAERPRGATSLHA